MVVIALTGLSIWYVYSYVHKQTKIVGSVTLGVPTGEFSSSFYIAEKRGFFTDNGLNVKLLPFETGADSYNALQKDNVDVSVQTEFIAIASMFKHEKVHIISTFVKFNLISIIGRRDHGITKESDLAGKRIGLPKNSIAEFFLARFLELHGMSIHDVTLVYMNYSECQEAIKKGSVDAVVTFPPYYDSIKNSLGTRDIDWSAQGDQQIYGILVSKDDWLTRNPVLVVRMLKAIDQADLYITQHPDEATSIAQKRLKLDTNSVKGIWQRNSFSLSLEQQLILAMEDEARWMLENKLVNAKEIPDFLDYINIDIMEKVRPDEVTIIH